MPSWSDLLDDLNSIDPERRTACVTQKLRASVRMIAERQHRSVLNYTADFLQTPRVPGSFAAINMEDFNRQNA